ncbi:uncharacterized protein LOC124114787 [Haliotis rufescens]|uniref:uncharacterized protein LOC124114787 n=1 Tax=Haliotis rufescens TaxID=6454 RepID=UPI00201E8A39|nr:uncharacterized protein LOC124114787 [Haliotis rufescens]
MNRCSILLVQMLTILAGGSSVVFGSLVLTSSPDTATDGELFTMTCTSSQSGGRAWSRDKLYPVLYTQQGNSKVILVSPRLTRDLLGRVTASGSSDGTQNNVTLKINSRIDNGTAWMCRDEIHGETSNTLTIVAVVAPPTTMVLTSLRSTQSTPTGISVSDAVVKSRLSPTTTTVILGYITIQEETTLSSYITTQDETTLSRQFNTQDETTLSRQVNKQDETTPSSYIRTQVTKRAHVATVGNVDEADRSSGDVESHEMSHDERETTVTKRANVATVGNVDEADRSSGDVESHEMSHDERETTDTYASVNKPKKTTFIADNGDIYALPNKPKK